MARQRVKLVWQGAAAAAICLLGFAAAGCTSTQAASIGHPLPSQSPPSVDGLASAAKGARVRNHLARVEGERPGFAQLVDEVAAAHDPFLFFRSFVAYFYDVAQHEAPQGALPPRLSDASGWCAGDPHLGNFGTLIDVHGAARLTIVDPDDAGFCPIILDALRFFTSLYVLKPDLPDQHFDKIAAAYRGLLTGRPLHWSAAGEAALKRSNKRAMSFDPDEATGGKLMARDKADRTYRQVTATEAAALATTLRQSLGRGSQLFDALRIEKKLGGSTGMRRYRLLVVPDLKAPLPADQGRLGLAVADAEGGWIFDLKEIAPAATRVVARGAVPEPAQAVRRSLQIMIGGTSPYYAVVPMHGQSYLLRPRWRGNKAFDPTSDQALELAEDAAQALAVWHLTGTSEPARYVEALQELPPSELRRWSRVLADRMRRDSDDLSRLK